MQPNIRRASRGLARGLARLGGVASRPAFQAAVLLAGLVLFYWPMLADQPGWTGRGLYLYLFAAWAAVVALSMLIGAAQPPAGRGPGRPPEPGE
jgi:hypothetical protein